jgi:hypothetical protein
MATYYSLFLAPLKPLSKPTERVLAHVARIGLICRTRVPTPFRVHSPKTVQIGNSRTMAILAKDLSGLALGYRKSANRRA